MCLVSAKQGASCLLLICLANRTRSSMMPSSRVGFPTPVATTSMPRMKLFQHRHAGAVTLVIHCAANISLMVSLDYTIRSNCLPTLALAELVSSCAQGFRSDATCGSRSCGSSSQLQLKGYSQTPFSRFADGLAVTHSSVREQLAGEQFFASARRPAKSVRNI
jgi:hypothetical protein